MVCPTGGSNKRKNQIVSLQTIVYLRIFTMISFLVILASVLPLIHSLDKNPNPCMPAKYNNAYNVFLKRHIPDGVPLTSDQNAWQAFLRKIDMCGRPTQSFFRANERRRVDNVCTKAGGKTLSGNLCISKEKFSFVTVRVDNANGTCGIRNIRNESKHIILACEDIGDVCQPVHFEGNPKDEVPSNNQLDCGARSGTKPIVLNVMMLLFTVVALICIL